MYLDGSFESDRLVTLANDFPDNLQLLDSLSDIEAFISSAYNIAVANYSIEKDVIASFIKKPQQCDIKLPKKTADHIYTSLGDKQKAIVKPYLKIFSLLEKHFPKATPRLTIKLITDQMCPLFHEDNIQIRLITTLSGPGTQWLADKDVLRKNLAKGGNKSIIKEGAILRQLKPLQIAIMKGKKNVTSKGLVHRSPPIDPCDYNPRLIVRFDLI